jgi:prepilin-type N-terminal cleavage/methylation domain-containing protein/prepilin-type processing-associated H-X9-DG protein
MSYFHRRAFTLIELLVVISIIAVLSGLVFSTYKNVRIKSQQTQCLSNLRQIGTALNQFTTDHDSRWPDVSHAEDETTWFTRLLPYLNDDKSIGISPGDPLGKQRLAIGMSSYIFNEYLAVPLRTPFGAIKEDFGNRNLITKPAELITVFPIADDIGLNAARDHTHSRKWTTWRAVVADIQPDRFRTGASSPQREKGNANYLYADGHAATVEAEWLRREFLAKRNPAKPTF